jgi:hypothetical protein
MKTPRDESGASALLGLIIMLLLALLFAVFAFFMGGRPVADAVRTAWRASSLVEVPATIIEVRIDSERTKYGSKGRLKALHAVYTYEWQGVRYRSSLVSLQQRPGTYNSLHWHDEWFAKLEHAHPSAGLGEFAGRTRGGARQGRAIRGYVAQRGHPAAVRRNERGVRDCGADAGAAAFSRALGFADRGGYQLRPTALSRPAT